MNITQQAIQQLAHYKAVLLMLNSYLSPFIIGFKVLLVISIFSAVSNLYEGCRKKGIKSVVYCIILIPIMIGLEIPLIQYKYKIDSISKLYTVSSKYKVLVKKPDMYQKKINMYHKQDISVKGSSTAVILGKLEDRK